MRKTWTEQEEGSKAVELCSKYGTSVETIEGREAAFWLDRGHRIIIDLIKQPGTLEGLPEKSKKYFKDKLEYERLWQEGKVKKLFDFYQTKDERMKYWESKEVRC